MDNSLALPTTAHTPTASPAVSTSTLPWYCYAMVFGAICIPVGVLWDISWHSTIGRDTFWTPAHMMTYLGGLLPGLTAGWLAIKTHFFGTEAERAAAVRFWGFRAPLGAWVTIWGSFMMMLSAPFDNWWHDAYGLDVKILSPPHSLLAAGMFAVDVGVLLLMLSVQNRAGEQVKASRWPFIITAGVLLLMAAIFLTEMSFPNAHRTGTFYLASCLTYPLYLVAAARGSKLGWGATTAAAVYMGLVMLMLWILPLFPAQPMLAPIYNPVDHMVSPAFPLLLIIPGVAIDLLMRWLGQKSGWLRDSFLAIGMGIVFLGLLLLVQWHFAQFLLSPAADNWFFGGNRMWPYSSNPGAWQTKFWNLEPQSSRYDPVTWPRLALAAGLAILAARVGLGFGGWMRKVKR